MRHDLTEDTRKLLGMMDNIHYLHCTDDLTGLYFVKTYQIVHLTYVQLIICHLYPLKLFYKKENKRGVGEHVVYR